MTIMKAVADWLRGYPGLQGRLDVDGPDEEAVTYSLDSVPCRMVLKRYRDGGSLRQCQFVLSSRRFHDRNIEQSLENLEFFEKLNAWMDSCGTLPELGDGRSCIRVSASTGGYPIAQDGGGTARYQMQLVMEYYQK